MENLIFYILALVLLLLSFFKDKNKTKKAIKKGVRALNNILPQFLGLITAVGILISVLNPEVISRVIGESSGWFGVIPASIVGSLTLIPAFVAFPTAAMLVENGAGYMQIAAFISTLMMVGIMTYPIEVRYLGKKATLIRNILSFIFAFIVALIIGEVV
jgi:uncharacterized membrane protein YraQ (UPF0718 family)